MAESAKAVKRPAKRLRCAIYTRKSSEEGLEQAFNSLDAQREACAAFILSQKHEGWTVLPTLYDDGGFSGAAYTSSFGRRCRTFLFLRCFSFCSSCGDRSHRGICRVHSRRRTYDVTADDSAHYTA